MADSNNEDRSLHPQSNKKKRQDKKNEEAKRKLEEMDKARKELAESIENDSTETEASPGKQDNDRIEKESGQGKSAPTKGDGSDKKKSRNAQDVTANPSELSRLAITPSPNIRTENLESGKNVQDLDKKFNKLTTKGEHYVNLDKAIAEISTWDFKIIRLKSEELAKSLSRFVTIGSELHKLTPDELTIVANHKGNYDNKEEKLVHKNGDDTVPDTLEGLLANGTRFLDALIYIGLTPEERPKCSPVELIEERDGEMVPPTYDDLNLLTTYIFVIFFYILIRAHPPSDNDAYQGQPVPKFISSIMGVKEPMSEIVDYVASFDLIKLNPSWVQFIPMGQVSQEAVNRFGLGVAGYRIVSIFNILQPDLYTEEPVPDGNKNIKDKPEYLDRAVAVARSFVTAGHCWDFHPATRDPNVITKYGNINKNANNLLIECFTLNTLNTLKRIGKLAVVPLFDPSHTNYKLWDDKLIYKATKPIFKNTNTMN